MIESFTVSHKLFNSLKKIKHVFLAKKRSSVARNARQQNYFKNKEIAEKKKVLEPPVPVKTALDVELEAFSMLLAEEEKKKLVNETKANYYTLKQSNDLALVNANAVKPSE